MPRSIMHVIYSNVTNIEILTFVQTRDEIEMRIFGPSLVSLRFIVTKVTN